MSRVAVNTESWPTWGVTVSFVSRYPLQPTTVAVKARTFERAVSLGIRSAKKRLPARTRVKQVSVSVKKISLDSTEEES